MTDRRFKIPVILYESEEQSLPYIEILKEETMPPALFIQEYKHTGDFEPSSNGEDAPIVEMHVHMYIDMDLLSKKLTPERYDEVRVSVGLKPLLEARKEGQKVLDKVYGNVNDKLKEAHTQHEQNKEELAKRFNEKLTEKFFDSEKKEEEETEQSGKNMIQFNIADNEEEEQ